MVAPYYINDFNVFGRTWQVNLQAETSFRQRIDDIERIYVRNGRGDMVPMRALAKAELVQGPQTVVRYNGFRGAIVNGAPKPGYSSGQGIAAMERVDALLAGLSIPFSLWPGGSFDAFSNEFLKSVLIFGLVANVVNTVRRMQLMIASMALWATIMAWGVNNQPSAASGPLRDSSR